MDLPQFRETLPGDHSYRFVLHDRDRCLNNVAGLGRNFRGPQVFGGKVLTPSSLDKMVTGFKGDYGCGLYVKQENGGLRFEHDGNNIGFNTHLAYYPKDKLAVIILGNLNTGITKMMADSLAAVVNGHGNVVWAGVSSSRGH